MQLRALIRVGLLGFVVAAIGPIALLALFRASSEHAAAPEARLHGQIGARNELVPLALAGWPTPIPTATLPPPPPPPPPPPAQPPIEEPVAVDAPPPAPSAPVDVVREWQDYEFASQVLASVNGQRQANGLAPLAVDGALLATAQVYAAELTQMGVLSHTADGDITSRALANGYVAPSILGEALWYGGGIGTSASVVDAWMNSPEHRDLILTGEFTVAGIGCYFKQAGSLYEGRCALELGG